MVHNKKGIVRLALDKDQVEIQIAREEQYNPLTEYYCDGRYFYGITRDKETTSCLMTIWDMKGELLARIVIPSASYLYTFTEDFLLFGLETKSKLLPVVAVSVDSLLTETPIIKEITFPEVIKDNSYD